VIITSKNPVKIEATERAFLHFFKAVEFKYCDPNILSQPIGENETYITSRNRVKQAQQLLPGADFYVGIEGGISLNFFDVPRIIVYCTVANHSRVETVRGCEIPLAENWYTSLLRGNHKELGDLVDEVGGFINIKQKEGAIGYLTGNYVKRVDILTHGVAAALIPFVNPDIF